MSRDFIKRAITAFLIRGPFALAVFFMAINQNKYFSNEDIIILGEVLSSSVIFSIIFIQPLGNIFNKTIASINDESEKQFVSSGLLLLILVLPIFIILPFSIFNHFIVFSISLAIAQCSFQWSLSFLTVKDSKKVLILLPLCVSVYFVFMSHLLFGIEGLTISNWLTFLIISYALPSLFVLSPLFNWTFISNFKINITDFLKKMLKASSFYSVLALIYWFVEFFPRISSSFSNNFILEFNVYMTIAIGFVGIVDIGLSQIFLKDYLILVNKDKKKFKSFFLRLIKSYLIIYSLVFIIVIFLLPYIWPIIFDANRFDDFNFFYFLFLVEISRILNFHSFNVFYYLGELKIIYNSILFMLITSVLLILLSYFQIISGILYLLLFFIMMSVLFVFNIKKVNKIL